MVLTAFPPTIATVASSVRTLLATADLGDSLTDLLLARFAQPGQVLGPEAAHGWCGLGLATMAIWDTPAALAIPLATTIACLAAMAETVDDVMDGVWPSGDLTATRLVNAGPLLVTLAQHALLAAPLPAEHRCAMLTLLHTHLTQAHRGQDADVQAEGQLDLDEQTVYAIAARKSGPFGALAMGLAAHGAGLAAGDVACLTMVGQQIGVMAQLRNDADGIAPQRPFGGTDLQRGKVTLPVAVAYRHGSPELRAALHAWYATPLADRCPAVGQRLAQQIVAAGGLAVAAVAAEAQRNAALATLAPLVATLPPAQGAALKRLVPPVFVTPAP